jgi:membrane protein DedA with SNARE-associated domain
MGDLVHRILDIITQMGYWGIMLGLMIEVIPSEIVLAYAGFLVEQGKINFAEAVIFGTIGGVIAQLFIYWIGRYGGRPFVEKFGKYIFIHKKHIDAAEAWFNRYGTGVIFTARFIPVVRHAISIPAGMARMSLTRFTIYTTLAIIPWSILFIFLGQKLSQQSKNWSQINEIAGPYVKPFIWAAVAMTVLYLGYKWFVKRNRQA